MHHVQERYTSLGPTNSSKFFASIISPTTVLLTIRKSRSTSAMSLLQLELEQQAVDQMHRSESLPAGIAAHGANQMTKDATGRSEDGILAVEMNRNPTKNYCEISELCSKDRSLVKLHH